MNTTSFHYREHQELPWILLSTNVEYTRMHTFARDMHAEPITHDREGLDFFVTYQCEDGVQLKLTKHLIPQEVTV